MRPSTTNFSAADKTSATHSTSDIVMLWRYVVVYRTLRWARYFAYVIVALGVPLMLGLRAFGLSWHKAVAFGIGSTWGAVYFSAWIFFVSGACLICAPAQVKLLPRIRQSAIKAVLFTTLLGMVAGTIVIGPYYGSCERTFLILSAYLLGLCYMQARAVALGMLTMILFMFLLLGGSESHVAHFLSNPIGSGAAFILLALIQVHVLHVMFPNGGERSYRLMSVLQRQERLRSNPMGEMWDSPTFLTKPYVWFLQRHCAGRAGPSTMMMHLLGPRCHWSEYLRFPVILFAIGMCGRIWLWLRPDPLVEQMFAQIGVIPLAACMMIIVIPVGLPIMQVNSTRTEQGLYRLAPCTPPSRHINRALAFGIVRYELQSWLLCTLTVVGASAMLGASPQSLGSQLCLCILLLPSVSLSLLNYAQVKDFRKYSMWIGIVLAIMVMLVPVAVAAIAAHLFEDQFAMSCIAILATLLIGGLRLRNMLSGPVALPLGRMDS